VVQARKAIIELSASLAARAEATPLFARERPGMLEGILGNLEQTFGGVSLYPTVEARAAHLLYFIIKDHPFSDGNKRIGCFLFLHYLDKNRALALPDGSLRFDGNALVALALLIAESDPGDKDLMVRLIIHLLSQPQPQRRDRAPALARQ
jgi:prophage maintenance system killer protein